MASQMPRELQRLVSWTILIAVPPA